MSNMNNSLEKEESEPPTAPTIYSDVYPVTMGSQKLELPIIPLSDDLAIALLMSVDVSLSCIDKAGAELADLLRPFAPRVIVTAATLGIPVAVATAKALGLDTIIVLHKSNKIHLADALTEPLSSITTQGNQVFRLDRARAVKELQGQDAVVFVDDVISTGGSAAAALRLIHAAGGTVCATGVLLVEGQAWRNVLGAEHARNVVSLGKIPVFEPFVSKEGKRWIAKEE